MQIEGLAAHLRPPIMLTISCCSTNTGLCWGPVRLCNSGSLGSWGTVSLWGHQLTPHSPPWSGLLTKNSTTPMLLSCTALVFPQHCHLHIPCLLSSPLHNERVFVLFHLLPVVRTVSTRPSFPVCHMNQWAVHAFSFFSGCSKDTFYWSSGSSGERYLS